MAWVAHDKTPVFHLSNVKLFRCEHLRRMLTGPWKESQQSEVPMDHYSYEAFYAVLKYFYTDTINVSPFVALEVLDIANGRALAPCP